MHILQPYRKRPLQYWLKYTPRHTCSYAYINPYLRKEQDQHLWGSQSCAGFEELTYYTPRNWKRENSNSQPQFQALNSSLLISGYKTPLCPPVVSLKNLRYPESSLDSWWSQRCHQVSGYHLWIVHRPWLGSLLLVLLTSCRWSVRPQPLPSTASRISTPCTTLVTWRRNIPIRTGHLNDWSLAGGAVWGRLGSMNLLKEVWQQWQALGIHACNREGEFSTSCPCHHACLLPSSLLVTMDSYPQGPLHPKNYSFCKLSRS